MKINFKKIKAEFKIPFLTLTTVLAVVIVAVFGAKLFYQPKKMTKRGYEIEFSESGQVVKKEVKVDNIEDFMKLADAKNGEKIFKKCASCHNIERNGANKIGPNLHGVVGRNKASVSGFVYSQAMKNKGGKWNRESLNLFLLKPKAYVEGTKMGFSGLRKTKDRADVILYLENNR